MHVRVVTLPLPPGVPGKSVSVEHRDASSADPSATRVSPGGPSQPSDRTCPGSGPLGGRAPERGTGPQFVGGRRRDLSRRGRLVPLLPFAAPPGRGVAAGRIVWKPIPRKRNKAGRRWLA